MKSQLRLALAALALLAAAGPAAAQAQKKPPTYVTPPPPLRGAQDAQPVAPAPRPRPPASSTQTDAQVQPVDPSLRQALPPQADTTARIGGLQPEQAGGAQCRAACAQTYYFCLSNQGDDSCPTRWTQCLTACPDNSFSF